MTTGIGTPKFATWLETQETVSQLANFASGNSVNQRLVLVEDQGDLPTVVGGVIPLAANCTYWILDSFEITHPLFYPDTNTNVISDGAQRATITYNGTAPMFQHAAGAGINYQFVSFSCPNSPMFNSSGASLIRFENSRGSCKEIGTVANVGSFALLDGSRWDSFDTGLTFSGTCGVLLMNGGVSILQDAATTSLDLGTSTWQIIQIASLNMPPLPGGVALAGSPNDGNLLGFGSVFDSSLNTNGTPLVGITPADLMWDFRNVLGVKDSSVSLSVSFEAEQSTNVISNTVVPVNFNGGMVTNIAERCTSDSNGNITFTGLQPETLSVDLTGSFDKSGGGEDDYFFGLYKWDTVVGGSSTLVPGGRKRAGLTSAVQSVTWFAQVEANPGDIFYMGVEGINTGDNINTEGAQIRVTG